ncbi:MAG: Flp pilus assembly complex ATPase component TadA [Clostridia bacterium]|nr:Flp pilus assembly complex ATPase component TadA [Clostridia bacterium]
MNRPVEIKVLLPLVQEHISTHYSAALNDINKQIQLNSYIEKFLRDYGYTVEGYTTEELIKKLYSEMAEYSVLTPFLGRDDVEEINVNAWNDIAVTYTNGRIEKLENTFFSPQHATDIVKRLLHHSGMIIDNVSPMSQGHLPNNTRITALKAPIVDDEIGVSVSIRLLHPSRVNRDEIVKSGNATKKMIDFLCMCMRYGVSTVVAGATSSGKTTLLNALLTTIPDNKRVFTIESGSRELALVRKDESGFVTNNVVHTLSRPSDNEAYDITQEDLVVASLRFNPDIVCVGEMRDVECYSAVEASLTGHTVVSTVHAFAADAAHMRIALLCQKRFPIDFKTSLMQAGQAFPIVVYTHKLENNDRKIMDISECEILPNGDRLYHTLFRYHITKNDIVDGRFVTEGYFEQPEFISENLRRKLLQFGVSHTELQKFLEKGADYE